MADRDQLGAEYYRLKAAVYDPNTDLFGVQAVHDAVRALFDNSRWVGLIHVEVESRAQIESIYGWQVLDRILQAVSSVLHDARAESLPREAVLAQVGIYDARFLVFLPLSSSSVAPDAALDAATSSLGARLRRRFTSSDFDSMALPLTLKLGRATFSNKPFCRLERVIYNAMEEARENGHSTEPQSRSREQSELRRIIRDKDIDTLFQPVVEVSTSEIVGYEAFSRGPRDTALEKPLALFTCSEDLGLSRELDLVCQRRALERARPLAKGKKLFLNALPGSLLDPGFRDHLLVEMPGNFSVVPEDIVLEITERRSIGDYEVFEHEVGELRTQGFLLAVDDVGTGAGSLQTIAEVKPDFIKVDGSLIRGVHLNLVKQEMLRSLSHVAQSINATIIAEGIESEEELKVVKECGIRLGQGYLFARPGHDLSDPRGDA